MDGQFAGGVSIATSLGNKSGLTRIRQSQERRNEETHEPTAALHGLPSKLHIARQRSQQKSAVNRNPDGIESEEPNEIFNGCEHVNIAITIVECTLSGQGTE